MKNRWTLWLGIVLVLNWITPAFAQETDTTELLKAIDRIVPTMSGLRGLEPKAPILKGVKTREEISQYLNKRVREDYTADRIENEGKLLRKLGILPEGVSYLDMLLSLYTEQIGGFYDPKEKTLFLVSGIPAAEQEPVIIHELTHALQDQHFNIEGIMEKDRQAGNDDRALAHQALMEGDGMVVMLQQILTPMKRHFSELPNLALIMQTQMAAMKSQYTVLKSVPQFLQETMVFPYGYGASFIQQVWKQRPSWETINKIYSDLPASSEQIMHPEKYYATRDNPKTVNAGPLVAQLGSQWKVVYKNVLGEFSLGLLLNQHLIDERARRAASGWGGDQVLLLENASGKNAVLISTVWDTENDSEKFFMAMDEWFRRHFPKSTRTNETPTGFSLVEAGEFSSLRREGSFVRILIGLPETDSNKLTGF
jgi:hypothetical protein